MILPPPGFAQPVPDPSLRPLLEQEMRDLIALARNHVTHGVKGVLIVDDVVPAGHPVPDPEAVRDFIVRVDARSKETKP